MQTTAEERIRDILDELARGSNLDRTLGLIAEHTAASLGAPTCKVWVVKRGDICDRCRLATVCTNRQMCMHLVAASGAVVDREYVRIPLNLFSASMLARGGVSDFSEASGLGERLFGLQHGAQGESRDSYALCPLRGVSGTVGLIGIFNHRPIAQPELGWLAQLAPTAVAAIRVAELQSRCESLRQNVERETALLSSATEGASRRQAELEEAVAQLTQRVAQLQVEREPLIRARDEVTGLAQQLEAEKREMEQKLSELEAANQDLRQRNESLLAVQRESGHAYSEMTAKLESDRRTLEDENAWLKEQIASREQSVADLNRNRESLIGEMAQRGREIDRLRLDLEAAQSELASAREALPKLEERVALLEVANAGLRDHNAAVTESVDDLERSLRIAEDARARLEQTRVSLEQSLEQASEERDRLGIEADRINGENEQLVIENERLRAEVQELREAVSRLKEESGLASALEQQLTEARDGALARAAQLEREIEALSGANSELEAVLKKLESRTTRLEESAARLRDRAEAAERARADLEQRSRTLTEQNRRVTADRQAQARFLANMSHELRTPMNAIIGFTSLLLDDRALHLSDRHRRSLERVSRNARDLLELINNVLDLSKIEAGRMDVYSEPADARDLIERAMGVVEPLRENRPIKLTVDAEDDLPTLRTDRTKLQQILINLLSNAIKFTNEGEVKVSAQRQGADHMRIAVSDTGVGLSVTDFPKLFQEFQQFGEQDKTRRGTGLGLAITRRLVELLGGDISVSSRPGEGSVFAVTLPLEIEGRAAAASEIEAAAADPDRTALVIDSDPASLYLTKKYLSEAGYSVAATDDPGRGVEIARLARPAIVCVDLDLLEGGLDSLEQVARAVDGLVIAISTDPAAEARAKEAGARSFLSKPVERAELLRTLEQAPTREPGRILVVDDDADTLDLICAMLEGAGYQIVTAANGREALDQIALARPEALILDLMLPEMDGFEVVYRLGLNAEWRHIPVILLTARDLSHEERRALDIGTARILQKGNYSRDELLAELKCITGAAQPALSTPG